MLKLELVRSYLHDRTIGRIAGLVTLEPPWRDNAVGESCIPEGVYKVLRDKHGRFQFYRIIGVPGRSAIEFHGGVRPSHSRGCILLGENFTRTFDLEGSLAALEALMLHTKEQDFELTIRSFSPSVDRVAF